MNSIATAELILNLVWFAIAVVSAGIVLPRVSATRRMHVAGALLCALVLLFPIISVSDDLSADRATFELLTAVLVAMVMIFGLTAVARLALRPVSRVSFVLAKHADPRSPPAR